MSHAELLSSMMDGSVPPQSLDGAILAFEFDDDLVTVVPTRGADGAAAVEVSVFVGQLPPFDDSAVLETLRLLHRVNGEGLLHHGWMIASDEDRALALRRVLPLKGLDPIQLEFWVGQGTERAAGLRALIEGRAVPGASDPFLSSPALSNGAISSILRA